MKIAASILFCLSVLTCRSSDGQDTNKTAEVSGQANRIAEEVRHIDLKMDMPGGSGSVLMSEEPTLYLVQLRVGGGSSFEKRPPPDVSSLGLQVWLLKADGTTIHQHDKPTLIGIGNAGFDTDYMIYTFDNVPSNELAGIVLLVKGKLYCREINDSMIGPTQTPLNALCGRWQSEQGDSYEFASDGTYEHWQQTPPVSKLAQAEDIDASKRTGASKGRILVGHDSLVLIQKDGASITNVFFVMKDGAGNDKGKFFESGYSLTITSSDGNAKRYELMYR
jgi:hypothetical protein